MARLVYEGRTKVYWATVAPANLDAPTAAEVGAAIDLSPFITKDGVSVGLTQNKVDSATINETFNAQVMGSWGADVQLKMKRDDATETNGYDLIVQNTNGFLYIARQNADPDTDPVATDKIEVWPAEMGEPLMENSATDTEQAFMAPFAITSAPHLRAVVAV